jgi:hypothetical protein
MKPEHRCEILRKIPSAALIEIDGGIGKIRVLNAVGVAQKEFSTLQSFTDFIERKDPNARKG